MNRSEITKKTIVFIVITTILAMLIIEKYCSENIYFSINVTVAEKADFNEYVNKTMGFGGYIYNKTIFPIRIRKITPIGERGMKYHTTLVTTWGFSEIKQEDFSKYDELEGKIILPFTSYNLGGFFKFTDRKIVNPSAFVLTYSIFGIEVENIIIN
jgi:hypothetical protein